MSVHKARKKEENVIELHDKKTQLNKEEKIIGKELWIISF